MKTTPTSRVHLLAATLLLISLWQPQPVLAQTGYYMTLASRVCQEYTDIMANRARNNIQESLRDLGPDSVYDSGEPISPAIEDANDNCQPMATPWEFTLGSSIGGQDRGTFGRLSYVGGVNGSATTVAQVPELDSDGLDTGRTVDWAVTIELTEEQLELAGRNALWVQGGSPGDPLNGQEVDFGFGALRCAIDGLNGDNVESNQFPTGSKHVFCYAYYVNPPPTSGTIRIIKQQSANDTEPATQSFEFRGNLSYQQNGAGDNYFSLNVANGAASDIVFYRAETGPDDQPWTVWELVPPGWSLESANCTSQSGDSVVTPNGSLGSGGQAIALAADDTVTCTYTNRVQLPNSGLLISKSSTDGDRDNAIQAVGTFDFSVVGTGVSETFAITTLQERVPAISGVLSPLPVQQYTITETALPDSIHGDWRFAGVSCLGQQPDSVDIDNARVTLTLNQPAVCNFRNVLDFPGTLVIRKVTTNGLDRFTFKIGRPDDAAFSRQRSIVTTRVDEPSLPLTFDRLPYGAITITESSADSDDWELVDVTCNGQPVAHVDGRAGVVLTRTQPVVECIFTNTRQSVPDGGGAVGVPALGNWALLGLSALLGIFGAILARVRKGRG